MGIFNQDELTLPKPNYEYITTKNRALEVLKEIDSYDIIEVDTETTGLDPFTSKIVLLQLGVDNRAYVFDVRHDTKHSDISMDTFKDLLTDRSKLKLLQNAAYDMKMIKVYGDYYIENIYDTMLVEQLFNLGIKMRGFSLGEIVFKYTGLRMNKETATTFQDYNQVYKPYQLEYAASDVVVLGLIREMQLPMIEHHGFEDVCRLEFDFVKSLCEMELNGISMDVDKWRIMIKEMEVDKEEQLKVINAKFIKQSNQSTLFGVSMVNIDSPSQLKKALKDFGLELDSTSVETLNKYAGLDIIDSILKYRKTNKFISTYGENLIDRINPVTGKLHTSFRQVISTGRMSSSRPNMQNIPAKQKFRSCFVAEKGKALVTADMSGAELRILGNLSNDPIFIHCYSHDIDIHTKTASEVFKVPMHEAAKSVYRKPAKAVGFGICVADDTNLITSSGIKEIKDIVIGNDTVHDVGEDKIIDHKYMGRKECYRITTRYGYSLECTKDHIVKVIDANGDYTDKKICDLDTDNDSICIKCGSSVFSKTIQKLDHIDIVKRTNNVVFDSPPYLDDLWASFLGLFVSEGSLHKGRQGRYDGVSFGFSTKEPDLLLSVDVLFKSLFGTRHKCVIGKDIKVYALHSVHFAKWLSNILNVEYGDNKTNTIHVPVCVKQSPKNIQVVFMRWLWEGDGTVWLKGKRSGISYSSRSINLVHDLQIMLLNIGILSAVRQYNDKRHPENRYYKLDIVGNESRNLFMRDIGFVTNHKNSKYVVGTGVTIKSTYTISNQRVKLEKLKTCVLNNDIDISDWYTDNLNKITTDKKYYIKNVLNNAMIPGHGLGNVHLRYMSNGDGFIKFIYDNNIVPLPIKSIEKIGLREVYDISVENHQYFLANGIITHNCYGMSKYGLAARLDITEREADGIIKGYLNTYSAVSRFLNESGKNAVRDGYSRSISNRKRFYNLPPTYDPERKNAERSVERQAKNAPIQGCVVHGSQIKGVGPIGKCVGQEVLLETGFGKNTATGVYSGKKKVYNLRTSNGINLGITLEHKVPVCTDSDLIDKPVENIDLNKDMLMLPLDVVGGKETDLFGYKYEKGHWRETYVEQHTPTTMTSDLAFVVGSLIGDGCYSAHNNFRFVCPEYQIELFDKFNNAVFNTFNRKAVVREVIKGRYTKLYTSQVSSVVIRGFLKHIGLDYVTAKDKSVPEYFHTETVENKGALLNGLFSTDGGMTEESGPNYTTISRQLAEDIHNLLFSLGINSNLKVYSEEKSLVYRIQIPKRFNNKFKKLIGFSVNEKNNKLDTEGSVPKFGDDSVVPEFIPKLIEGTLRKSATYFEDFTTNEKAHLRRFKHGECSFTSWRKFYHRLPECSEKKYLSKFLNFDFCKAVSLEYRGKEDTYDLMCDKIHYFTANGVVVHNSNADTIKQSMIYCVERLEKLDYHAELLLTVHDELICSVDWEHRYDVAKIISQSLIDGFAKYFSTIPMETDALIGTCWLKGACENDVDGIECGGTEMEFISDEKYGTKLICKKCGADQ